MKNRWRVPAAIAGSLLCSHPAAAQDGAAASATGTVALAPGDDVYVVVPGDTLWGISQRFFGDPGGWPGIWSVNNDEITNPHYIYPGQVVRFSAGTVITPPSFGIGAPDAAVPYDETFQPVARFWSSNRQCGVFVPFPDLADTTRLAAPGFVAEDLRPLGKVSGAMEGKTEMGPGDILYLSFDNLEDVHCGDIYSLYSPQGAVRHPALRGQSLGTAYRVLAEVRITDVGERMATAEVVDGFFEVHRGDLVTDRLEVVADVRVSRTDRNVGGFVVGKLLESKMALQSEVVFIDKGRSDGVKSGDQFWVVRSGDELSPRTLNSPDHPDYIIGRLVVFAADEYHSTAVAVNVARELRVGDRITTYIERLDAGSGDDADGW